MSLASSLAASAGTNIIGTATDFVHWSLFLISQIYFSLGKTLYITIVNIVHTGNESSQKILLLKMLKTKTAGAVLLQTASTITEKEQPFCNTHNITFCNDTIIPFHQPGTGRQKNMKFTRN